MSASSDWIHARLGDLQAAINQRELNDLFELRELVPNDDWEALGNMQRSVTPAFKKRIRGYQGAVEPSLTNIQVRPVRQNGRERMFQRVAGINDPELENEPFEGEN